MALWAIDVLDSGKVTLSHIQNPFDARPLVEDCGSSENLAVLPQLEAWVADNALPFDLITCPAGTFVRQQQTNRGAVACA